MEATGETRIGAKNWVLAAVWLIMTFLSNDTLVIQWATSLFDLDFC